MTWNWLIKSMLFVGRQDHALGICERMATRTPWQETVRLALKAHADGRLQDAIVGWDAVVALDAIGISHTMNWPMVIKHLENTLAPSNTRRKRLNFIRPSTRFGMRFRCASSS